MPKPIQVGRKERMSFGKINEVGKMPNLIYIQTSSYDWFIREGLREVFEDISPIKDYAGNLSLEFIDYSLNDPPKYEQEECKERDVTYAAPLKVKVRLVNRETGEVKEQEVFMGDFPLMTERVRSSTTAPNGSSLRSWYVPRDRITRWKRTSPERSCSRPRLSRTAEPGSSTRRIRMRSSQSVSTVPENSR